MKYFKDRSAEHAWTNDHPINWADTKILQVNKAMELVLKESLSIIRAYVRQSRTRASTETAGMSCPTVGLLRTLRDAFVFWIRDQKLCQQLLGVDDSSYEKACDMAMAGEAAAKKSKKTHAKLASAAVQRVH